MFIVPKTLNQYRAIVRKQGVYLTLTQGSYGRNFDGTWWIAQWSDGETDHIKTTAHKRDHGMAYSRSRATAKAFEVRANRESVIIIL